MGECRNRDTITQANCNKTKTFTRWLFWNLTESMTSIYKTKKNYKTKNCISSSYKNRLFVDLIKTVLFRATTKTKVCFDSIVTDWKLTMEIKSISWNLTNIWLFWNRILPGSLIAFYFTSVLAYPARVSLDLPRRIEGDSAHRVVLGKQTSGSLQACPQNHFECFLQSTLAWFLELSPVARKIHTFLKLEGCSPRFFKLLFHCYPGMPFPKWRHHQRT